ncbi:heterokaryon incompatibility protein-domain-containing protein [Xylariaceae sp. FL0594]|nr:heterokaryon incompatibility protein-domain-containing protein [Xylariaceae sp. FL0594]
MTSPNVSISLSRPHRSISYHPLSTARSEIRILVISPEEDESCDLRCRLEHETLLSLSADFVALSYHWGDVRIVRQVKLSGESVQVTLNLYDALKQLRSRGIYRVWVDDLCINQYGNDEISQQIMRMSAIYRAASLVLAHISLSDPRPQRSLHRLVKRTEKLEIRDGEKRALFQILDSPYWLRSWIIQEISVNFEMVLVWGSQDFGLDELVLTFTELQGHLERARRDVLRHIQRLYHVRTSQLASQPISLTDTLGWCYRAQVTICRDRVFSLLGITHDGSILVPIPTYTSSEDDINRYMTLRVMRATRRLDILVSHRREFRTWYPNWFDPEYWFFWTKSQSGAARLDLRTYTNYDDKNSAGPLTGKLKMDGKSPVVQAALLGTILSCGPTLTETVASDEPDSHIVQPRGWENMMHRSGPRHDNTLYRLLVDIIRGEGGRGTGISTFRRLLRSPKAIAEVHHHAPWLLRWVNCCEAQGLRVEGLSLLTYLADRYEGGKAGLDVAQLCRQIRRTLEADMRLGCTEDGHVGWFHQGARTGDRIATFLGWEMLCVLRPHASGGYMLVSRCIVEGVAGGTNATRQHRLVDIKLV